MKRNLLDSRTLLWGEIIRNGDSFEVPKFQRDYSWTEEQWEDLWLDIIDMGDRDFHYMGYLVFQNGGKDDRTIIIDGQQRFTTLSILALAVIANIQKLIEQKCDVENNEERKKILFSSYIGHKDPTSLIAKTKLKLNRNNDDFYQDYITRTRKPQNITRLQPSQKLMLGAFNFFCKKITSEFGEDITGEKLASFLDNKIANKLFFSSMAVDDDLNAYKVFETLNSRGVSLSPTDLLKNFLFMLISKNGDEDLYRAEKKWQNINSILGKIEFTTYLRHFWNSRNEDIARKGKLFKTIKTKIKTADIAFKLLDDLEDSAEVYTAFSQPENELWQTEDQKKFIKELKLFEITQCYPLLLSAYKQFDSKEFALLLRFCSVIAFRYNVISNFNPNIIETEYGQVAYAVHNGELTSAKEIFNKLKAKVYVQDDEFETMFTRKQIHSKGKSRKKIRYILFKIENQISGTKYDSDDIKITIEHILPENPSPEWEEYFSIAEQEEVLTRIGNYTLLEDSKNKECDNKLYEDKRENYENSSFKITKEAASYTEWNLGTLNKRQKQLAKYAKTVWKIT